MTAAPPEIRTVPPFTEVWEADLGSNDPISFDGYLPPSSDTDSVRTGLVGTSEGPLAVIECRFANHGGTMGVVARERTVRADRLLMLSGAVFSVIGPEAGAAILYRDPAPAPRLARSLRLTAPGSAPPRHRRRGDRGDGVGCGAAGPRGGRGSVAGRGAERPGDENCARRAA